MAKKKKGSIPECTLLANDHQAEPALAYMLTLLKDPTRKKRLRAIITEFQQYRNENPELMK